MQLTTDWYMSSTKLTPTVSATHKKNRDKNPKIIKKGCGAVGGIYRFIRVGHIFQNMFLLESKKIGSRKPRI